MTNLGTLIVTERSGSADLEALVVPEAWLRARFKVPEAHGLGALRKQADALQKSLSISAGRARRRARRQLPPSFRRSFAAFAEGEDGILFYWREPDAIRLEIFSPSRPASGGALTMGEWLIGQLRGL